MFKSGFIAILGRPNVGKSTLMNTLIGQKVAITTKKAGTTRNQIKGIWNTVNSQVVFLDTPGISTDKKTKLDKEFSKTSFKSASDVDGIIYIISLKSNKPGFDKRDIDILENLSSYKVPIKILLSKEDMVDSNVIDKLIQEIKSSDIKYDKLVKYNVFDIDSLNNIKEEIVEMLPEGEPYYLDDSVTDISDNFYIREIIREKALLQLSQELPHSVNVKIEEIDFDKDVLKVRANIIVERESQKGMVIGRAGKVIKRIGTDARRDLEDTYDSKVFLDLRVKVKKNWRDNEMYIKEFKL